jgi:hypothetical protein
VATVVGWSHPTAWRRAAPHSRAPTLPWRMASRRWPGGWARGSNGGAACRRCAAPRVVASETPRVVHSGRKRDLHQKIVLQQQLFARAPRFLLENQESGDETAAAHPRPAEEEPTQFLVGEHLGFRENNCCWRTSLCKRVRCAVPSAPKVAIDAQSIIQWPKSSRVHARSWRFPV